MKTLFIFLACLLCVGKANAQKEANIWYFGNAMQLQFEKDTMHLKDDGMVQTIKANSSICDKNGDLLFYTDGITAWNMKHQKIKKADSLAHAGAVLIVPKPEQEGVYFMIGVQVMPRYTSILRHDTRPKEEIEKGFWGKKDTIYVKEAVLSYSVVDMRKNNGLGEVIQKNVPILDSCLADMCAIKHENQKDFWLIVHQNYSNKFLAYKIDKQGISKNPVITEIGSRIERNHQNYMELSSNHTLKGALNGKK
jgi:hypothetical protein